MIAQQIATLKTLVLFNGSSFRKLSDVEIADAKEIVEQHPAITTNDLLHTVVRRERELQIDRI